MLIQASFAAYSRVIDAWVALINRVLLFLQFLDTHHWHWTKAFFNLRKMRLFRTYLVIRAGIHRVFKQLWVLPRVVTRVVLAKQVHLWHTVLG
jgi:hypothetical protein